MKTRLVLGVILVISLGSGMTILAASAEPKQQLQQQLTTFGNNTNNMIGNESMLLSSSSSTVNIRPNIQTDFNPNVTDPTISEFAYWKASAGCTICGM
jgi:hypothetical protein